MCLILSEKQFKYVSFAINNDINETIFSCLKNSVNQEGPLGHKCCALKSRAVYTDLACTEQQLLLDVAVLPEAVLSTPFTPNVLYMFNFLYYYA